MQPAMRRLSLRELEAEFNFRYEEGSLDFNTPPSMVWEQDSEITGRCAGFTTVVFDGDTTLPALQYYDSSHFAGYDCNCILVNGNLTIEGTLDLAMSDHGLPAYVFVLGDLIAENVFIREQCELTVTGSMTVKNVLAASRWANGRLIIQGDLDARHAYIDYFYCHLGGRLVNPLLLAGDEDHFPVSAENEGKVIPLADWHVREFEGVDDLDMDDPLFQQHVVFNDYMFQSVPYNESEDDKLMYWTLKGINVFRPLPTT